MTDALPTGPRGQALALALVVAVAGAAWVAIAAPLIGLYDDQADHLESQRTFARRMGEVASTLPNLRRQAGGIGVTSPSINALLEGTSDAVAAARVQEILQATAVKSNAAFSSLETLPTDQTGAYHRIALRASMTATWPVLVGLLRSIEANTPRLLIDDLRLTGSRLLVRTGPNTLDATFTVIGFRTAGADVGRAAPR